MSQPINLAQWCDSHGNCIQADTATTTTLPDQPPAPWDLTLWWLLDAGVAMLVLWLAVMLVWASRFCAQTLRERQAYLTAERSEDKPDA